MLKAYCSHCQGTELGTADNPRFSIREDYSYGVALVEVLKDGGPIHAFDEHFQFGVRKAEMLIASVSLLREFWQSSEDERLAFKPQLIMSENHDFLIWAEMHTSFEHSLRGHVEEPYLSLTALPPHDEDIGVGVMKCRAICAVEEDLRLWLRCQGVLA